MTEPYEAQKIHFSNLQGKYHKLLNTLKNKEFSSQQLMQLIKINETLDILESQVMDFNENTCDISDSDIETITKNNDTIEFLKPIAILHRFLLDMNN